MSNLGLHGDTAPPIRNGEMVFEAPWQNRLFGIAEALCQQGYFVIFSKLLMRNNRGPPFVTKGLLPYHFRKWCNPFL